MRRFYSKPAHQQISPAYPHGQTPLPHPDGWFTVALSREIKPGQVLTRRLAGEDVVLWRTRLGNLHATRPYCPHLGAHLGLGTVKDHTLVCSFHGFGFDSRGECVKSGYNSEPIKQKLKTLPVREIHGLVLIWHHHQDAQPQWEIPELETAGWSSPVQLWAEFAGHPQEIMENAFDTGHLTALHGHSMTSGHAVVAFDGAQGSIALRLGIRLPGTRISFQQQNQFMLYGLGYLIAHISFPRGITVRGWGLATPLDPWRVQLRTVVTAKATGWGPLNRIVAIAAARLALYANGKRFALAERGGDVPVWATKKYQSPPHLSGGDGLVGKYRQWCKQFYPDERARSQDQMPGVEGPDRAM
ncbi:Rieske 2Fe-2S domain-containing protein [Streptomyces olivoreticuli]